LGKIIRGREMVGIRQRKGAGTKANPSILRREAPLYNRGQKGSKKRERGGSVTLLRGKERIVMIGGVEKRDFGDSSLKKQQQ